MSWLHTLLVWYLFVFLLGLVSLPISWRLFGNLPDRGCSLSRILGVLLTGTTVWVFSVYGSVGKSAGSVWLAVLLLAALSWGRLFRRASNIRAVERLFRLRVRTRSGGILEIVFLASFLSMALLRVHDPAANHTEQPMDLLLGVAVHQSPAVPPGDPWLSGYAVGYYYFGYWLQACLAHATGTPPQIAYNMSQVVWFALLFTGVFGLAYNLILAWTASRGDRKERQALAVRGALATGLGVVVCGNLYSFLEWFYAQGLLPGAAALALSVGNLPEQAAVTGSWFVGIDWWWWRPTRLFQDFDLSGNRLEVISEFPVFSYILGDNHPHLQAMPLALLVIGLSMNLLFSTSRQAGLRGTWARRTRDLLPWGIAVGALAFVNSWDFPVYFFLPVAAFWIRASDSRSPGSRHWSTVWFGGCLLLWALLLFWPYLVSAQSQVRGFAPNLFHPTRMVPFALMFGPFLLGLSVYLWWLASRERQGRRQLLAGAGAGAAAVVFVQAVSVLWVWLTETGRRSYPRVGALLEWEQLSQGLSRWLDSPFVLLLLGSLAGLVLAGLFGLVRYEDSPRKGADLLLLLAALGGLLLVVGSELFYVRDSFESRMNTIFKTYYQAWLLLGLAGTLGCIRVLHGRNRGLRLASMGVLLVIGLGIAYPLAAGYSKALAGREPAGLDAVQYVRESQPGEYAAIEWIRGNTSSDALVLQAVGESYRAETSRVSAATGRPTLIGWVGHERQWRGSAFDEMAGGREDAVRTIYSSSDPTEVSRLIERWKIDYIFLGPVETGKYPVGREGERAIQRLFPAVFEGDGVRILDVRRR